MAVLDTVSIRTRRGARPLARRLAVTVPTLLVIVVVFLLPYLWILSSSFKDQVHIFSDVSPLSWRTFWPTSATIANYITAFTTKQVAPALLNSFIVAICQVGGTLVLGCLAAFGLTRIEFPGRRLLFGAILVTFLVPMEALVVPLYGLVSGLGLSDSLAAVFLPWIASPFALFMLRQAYEDLPLELDEAAYIDGAGHLRVLWSIILPNIRSTIAATGLVTFLFSWNSFLWPLVINSSSANTVIQVAVAQSTPPGQLPNWGETFAGAMIATVPLIIVFLFAQRHIVQGLAQSGLK